MKRTVILQAPDETLIPLSKCRPGPYYGVALEKESSDDPVDLNNRGYITKRNTHFCVCDMDEFTEGGITWTSECFSHLIFKSLLEALLKEGCTVHQFDTMSELALWLEGK